MKTKKRLVLIWGLLAASLASSHLISAEPPKLTLPELEPRHDGREVTLTFTVARTEGVSQVAIPGKPMTFIIETEPEGKVKSLMVWVSGDLADVMERLQMGLFSPNLKKGTRVQATGRIRYDPPTAEYPNRLNYYFEIDDWKGFRIVTEQEPGAKK